MLAFRTLYAQEKTNLVPSTSYLSRKCASRSQDRLHADGVEQQLALDDR